MTQNNKWDWYHIAFGFLLGWFIADIAIKLLL